MSIDWGYIRNTIEQRTYYPQAIFDAVEDRDINKVRPLITDLRDACDAVLAVLDGGEPLVVDE